MFSFFDKSAVRKSIFGAFDALLSLAGIPGGISGLLEAASKNIEALNTRAGGLEADAEGIQRSADDAFSAALAQLKADHQRKTARAEALFTEASELREQVQKGTDVIQTLSS